MEVILGLCAIAIGLQAYWVIMYGLEWCCYYTDPWYRAEHGKPKFWLWNVVRSER